MTAILAEFLSVDGNFFRRVKISPHVLRKNMPFSFAARILVSPEVMIRMVGEESVLLNLKTELYLGLDPVGTRMWVALTESPSLQVAYELILTEFDVEPEELRRDLEEFIGKLLQYQLVEVKTEETSAAGQAT